VQLPAAGTRNSAILLSTHYMLWRAPQYGGGFSAVETCVLTLTNCAVTNCVAKGGDDAKGGGIRVRFFCFVTLTNCAVISCVADGGSAARASPKRSAEEQFVAFKR